jgi:FtsX-like permease family
VVVRLGVWQRSGMRRLRRIGYPLRLAAGRLRHRVGSAALLLLGIAAAAAALAAVLGGSLVAQDESVARALEAVPSAQRSVAVTYADLGLERNGVTRPQLEPLVDRTLGELAAGKPVRAVQFKLLRIGGSLANLAAVEDPGRWVRLTSGRLPHGCTPERCEVVQLGGSGAVPSAPGLRFVRVGTGVLTSSLPFGRLTGANSTRVGESFGVAEPPFLVADSFEGLSALPELRSLYRTYAWLVPLRARELHPWEIDRFEARAAQARSTLRARSLFLNLSAPVEQLAAARESGQVAGRRLLLVGGQAAALLLAFAVLAAAGMRRDVEATRHRLTWFGARGWQIGLLVGAETFVLALLGALLGWAVGAGATAAIAGRAGSPTGGVVAHSVLASSGIAVAVVLAAAAGAVLLLSLSAPAVSLGGRRFTALDAAAVGALLAVVLSLARGNADARSLAASGGTGTLLLLLPGLVTFVVAVAAARLLVPGLRLLERIARRGSVPVRLAALSLARTPGSAAVAVTFLVVSLGLGLFAAVYRSTLDEGLSEQAAYAVPRDYTVREDLSPAGLVAPLDAAPLGRYRALGAAVAPVIRRTASAGSEQITVLGVPADVIAGLDGWRDDFSPLPRAELVDRVRPNRDVSVRGPVLPADATELRLPYTVRGGGVALTAVVETRRGLFMRIGLGDTSGSRTGVLAAPVPQEARSGRVVALELARPLSVEGHGEFARVDGVLTLGLLTAGAPLVRDYAAWTGRDGVEGTGSRLRFLLTNEAANPRFQPRQATDSSAPAVVATPGLAATAGEGGILPLRLPGGEVPVRVVGTVRRFPSASGDFVIGDEQALLVAMNAANPGGTVANELWLAGPASVGRALGRAPFAPLAVSSRAALESRLRADPLARGSLIALAGSAIVALLLAVAGLGLLLTGEGRDERGELTDLEAQGAGPATLRRHLRLRALLVALLGLVGGLAAAAILSSLVVGLVTLTANASPPEPPLALSVDWLLLSAACALYFVLAAALVALSTRRAV